MTKKAYIHAFKTTECLLGKQKEFTIKDLAVQFGCMEASNLAQQIHQRYILNILMIRDGQFLFRYLKTPVILNQICFLQG